MKMRFEVSKSRRKDGRPFDITSCNVHGKTIKVQHERIGLFQIKLSRRIRLQKFLLMTLQHLSFVIHAAFMDGEKPLDKTMIGLE